MPRCYSTTLHLLREVMSEPRRTFERSDTNEVAIDRIFRAPASNGGLDRPDCESATKSGDGRVEFRRDLSGKSGTDKSRAMRRAVWDDRLTELHATRQPAS